MPVLAIGGAASARDMLSKSLEPLAADLRGRVFDDCGQFVPDEQPERPAAELTALIGGQEV